MLSTDAALPVPKSLIRILPAAGTMTSSTATGGLVAGGLAADAAEGAENLNFAQVLGLEIPSAAADRGAAPAPALLTVRPELTLAPAALLPEAAAPEAAALLQDGGKPGKAAGKTLPIGVPPMPSSGANTAQADADGVDVGESRLPAPAGEDKPKVYGLPEALPVILAVAAPLPTLVEAVAAPTTETLAAPRAAPVSLAAEPGRAPAPESKSGPEKPQPVPAEPRLGIPDLPATLPAAPAPASPAIAQALASVRVLAGDKSPTDLPSPASGRAAVVAPVALPIAAPQAAAPLQVPAAAVPAEAQQLAAPLTEQPAPARLAARSGKDAPEAALPAAAPAGTEAPAMRSATQDPLAPLAAPVLPSLAADLVVAVQGPVEPATAQVVRSAPQPLPAGTDFAGLIDRLVEARDAASLQSGGGATIGAMLAHAEFGRVSMQFRQDDGALSVSMASNDPGFAPAVQMAAAATGAGLDGERSEAGQDQQQARSSGNQNAGQGASGSAAQSNGQSNGQPQQGQPQPAWPRGGGRTRTGEEQGAESRQADGSIYV